MNDGEPVAGAGGESHVDARRAASGGESDERLALVGLGLLGGALADRLLAAGRPLDGYDLDPLCRDRFAAAGGRAVDRLDAVVEQSTRLLLALPDSRVVRSVLKQIGDALRPGSLVIDSTTGDPEDSIARAADLAVRSVEYVEATVVGSSAQVRAGRAVMLLAGDERAVAEARRLLRPCAEAMFCVGPSGSAARLKLIVNLVLGLNRAALAEGLHLARRSGLDLPRVLEVLQATPAASAIMETKGPKMIARDFSPQARLAQHHKDVRLILETAGRVGASTPLSETHERLLRAAVEAGYGELDNSAVLRALETLDDAVDAPDGRNECDPTNG